MKQKKIDEEKKQESGESRKSLSKLKEKESEKTDTLDIAPGEEGDETFITSFNALEITAIRPYFDSTDLLELDERSPGVINEWMTLVKETSKSENSIRNRRSNKAGDGACECVNFIRFIKIRWTGEDVISIKKLQGTGTE